MHRILRILVLVLMVLLLQGCGSSKSFDDKAIEAYNTIEQYFINQVPVSEWEEDMMKWIHENMKEMEVNPDKYGEKESIVFENLSKMMVSVGMMNSLDYRDRILEEKYYNSRDMVRPYLGIEY